MSEIDYSLLRSLTAHEVCRALERDGFTFTPCSQKIRTYCSSRGYQSAMTHTSS